MIGLPTPSAQKQLRALKFNVREDPPRFDESAPAGRVLAQSPKPGTELREGEEVRISVSKGPALRVIPDLSGVPEAQAEARLRALQLEIVAPSVRVDDDVIPAGSVKSWSPQGSQPRGTRVQLVISNGPAPIAVPLVAGKSAKGARADLEEAGFVTVVTTRFSDVPAGQVVGTNPKAGSLAERNAKVTIVVSKGPELVSVPDVRTQSTTDATAAIEAAGLKVSGTQGAPTLPVVRTEPRTGSKVKRGVGVVLITE